MHTETASKEFYTPVRVYIEDTDAGRIVYYVNYLKYLERARTELFRALGFAKPAMIAEGALMVVASVQVDYKRSARLDDALQVTARITKVARSYVVFDQRVLRDSQCLCAATVKVACVNRESMKPRAMPTEVMVALQQQLGNNTE